MPAIEERLKDKIDELEIKINQKNTEVQDLSLELNTIKNLTKNHRHQGMETISIETIIKNAQYVDAKDFRISGTAGLSATISVRKGDDSGACDIVVTNGIITSHTC